MADEAPIDITWAFYYFRRHIAKEKQDCIRYIKAHPDMQEAFKGIIASSGAGMCSVKCLCCGKHIFGDQALGGLVVIASTHAVGDMWYRCLSPICTKCANLDLDIISTKCIDYMRTDMFKDATNITVHP